MYVLKLELSVSYSSNSCFRMLTASGLFAVVSDSMTAYVSVLAHCVYIFSVIGSNLPSNGNFIYHQCHVYNVCLLIFMCVCVCPCV